MEFVAHLCSHIYPPGCNQEDRGGQSENGKGAERTGAQEGSAR